MSELKRKTFDLLETKTDGEAGQFTALASVFGNVDHVGDRMMKGAFSKTLERWRKSGDPIPIILSHQWENPFALIGKADPRAVVETEKGLLVQGQLDIEHNDTAKQVHSLMKNRLLKGWSFGYTVPDDGEKINEEDGANEVTEVDLVEVGPTLKGANPEAQLQAVKSALEAESEVTVEIGGEPVQTTASTATNEARTIFNYPPVEDGDESEKAIEVRPLNVIEGPPEEPAPEEPEPVAAEIPLTGEALEKAIEESDRLQEVVAKRVEERLAEEREKAPEPPVEDLQDQQTVETVESEQPEEPAKPAAKADPLKNEIDLLRLEIAVGKPLRR